MDPSALNAAVIAAHAPGRFERLLFGFANWYLSLLSRTRLGMRILRGLERAEVAGFPGGMRQREHHFHRSPKPQRNTPRRGLWQAGRTSGLVHGMRPLDFPLTDQNPVIGARSTSRGAAL